MNITGLGKNAGSQYFQKIMSDICISELFVPDGKHPNRNAWLTITMNYNLIFVDRKNPGGVVFLESGKPMARDTGGRKFEAHDWTDISRSSFERRFREASKFWNEKFLLIAPHFYTGLDYMVASEAGFVYCPNVLCLFNLDPAAYPKHLTINVVRANSKSFWSDETLWDDRDVFARTRWHELGHALDQVHIKGLLGDKKCMVDFNDEDCYKTPPGMEPNIMGDHGTGLIPANAKAWLELISRHTETARASWQVSMNTKVPPKRLPASARRGGGLPKLMNIPNF
jgi:hypothetical protein